MKLLKHTFIATTLALSLGAFSSSANAVCLGMACMYNKMTPLQGIEATLDKVHEALESVKLKHSGGAAGTDQESTEVIINNIKESLVVSKEINANDKVDRNRNRANDYLKKARKAVKDGDLDKATEELKEAAKRFEELKGMLDLSQADRAAQQTHMLNRILDKPDR